MKHITIRLDNQQFDYKSVKALFGNKIKTTNGSKKTSKGSLKNLAVRISKDSLIISGDLVVFSKDIPEYNLSHDEVVKAFEKIELELGVNLKQAVITELGFNYSSFVDYDIENFKALLLLNDHNAVRKDRWVLDFKEKIKSLPGNEYIYFYHEVYFKKNIGNVIGCKTLFVEDFIARYKIIAGKCANVISRDNWSILLNFMMLSLKFADSTGYSEIKIKSDNSRSSVLGYSFVPSQDCYLKHTHSIKLRTQKIEAAYL